MLGACLFLCQRTSNEAFRSLCIWRSGRVRLKRLGVVCIHFGDIRVILRKEDSDEEKRKRLSLASYTSRKKKEERFSSGARAHGRV